ncbi:regulator [Pontibacillus halophilus JSM 076056 = DSM 19796]|uniref:Regulator n=1 Tax=Pontibacillus halophilus JSM 076056 = DSM 19796 TaxID=1385510 RepID=A0A0A5IBR9_9BACI|nr:YlbF family regulator [Pontibacillus halophilus]KGX93287.1 regulator [Pontibacillus halophilus JSM 076056 = DSM 19796]
MLATNETVEILDRAEKLGQMVLASETYLDYVQAKRQLEEDQEAQGLIQAFQDSKVDYEEVQRFGRYHPDYNSITKAVRLKKRDMDMNDSVANYKIAERNLQKLLDEISGLIANSVSPQIKAPKDGAVFQDTGSGCGCGSGGACGCAS